MEWYYTEAGERSGPISDADLRALLADGRVSIHTLVWRAGMAGWEPLGSVQQFEAGATAAAEAACTECGRALPPDELLKFENARICAWCKPVFFERLRELGFGAVLKKWRRYAGFWIRVLARVIDSAILGAVSMAVIVAWEAAVARVLLDPKRASVSQMALVFGGLGVIYLLTTAAYVAYEAWFLAHRGATPGKLAVGVRVVRTDGASLTRGRSIGRAFGYLLSNLLPLGIGFIMAGIDEEKRALHDRICDTRVVYRS